MLSERLLRTHVERAAENFSVSSQLLNAVGIRLIVRSKTGYAKVDNFDGVNCLVASGGAQKKC